MTERRGGSDVGKILYSFRSVFFLSCYQKKKEGPQIIIDVPNSSALLALCMILDHSIIHKTIALKLPNWRVLCVNLLP